MMRMSVNKSVAVFLTIIVILTPLSFAESGDDNTNSEQIQISGQATLSLTGDDKCYLEFGNWNSRGIWHRFTT